MQRPRVQSQCYFKKQIQKQNPTSKDAVPLLSVGRAKSRLHRPGLRTRVFHQSQTRSGSGLSATSLRRDWPSGPLPSLLRTPTAVPGKTRRVFVTKSQVGKSDAHLSTRARLVAPRFGTPSQAQPQPRGAESASRPRPPATSSSGPAANVASSADRALAPPLPHRPAPPQPLT